MLLSCCLALRASLLSRLFRLCSNTLHLEGATEMEWKTMEEIIMKEMRVDLIMIWVQEDCKLCNSLLRTLTLLWSGKGLFKIPLSITNSFNLFRLSNLNFSRSFKLTQLLSWTLLWVEMLMLDLESVEVKANQVAWAGTQVNNNNNRTHQEP